MNNKLKALAVIIAGSLTSQVALAESTAVLTWSGTVGSGIAHNDYMITGQNGSTSSSAFEAKLNDVQSNATFDSAHIVLELRENAGTATAPIPGDLWSVGSELAGSAVSSVDITWSVQHAHGQIKETGKDLSTLNSGTSPIVVSLNGEDVAVGDNYSVTTQNQVGVGVRNETPLDPNEVAGKELTVEVGISATAV